MQDILKRLSEKCGTYEGYGVNHEGRSFYGVLKLDHPMDGKGLTVDYTATADNGDILHREHSILGRNLSGAMSLWVMGSNHPGIVEHSFFEDVLVKGADASFSFKFGNPEDKKTFREIVSIDLWPGGDVTYRYAWGMPGAEFKPRSSAVMVAGRNRTIAEAKLKKTDEGWVPEGFGWYVLNAQESRWRTNPKFGSSCHFEGSERFAQYGFNLHVLQPGQPNCHYHGEDDQEDFLVLQGECRLIIEGQQRLLGQWDFVHCPKWTRHVFIGIGTQPCTILMVGGRTGRGVTYPVLDLIKADHACAEFETDLPQESYKNSPRWADARAPQLKTELQD